MCTDKISSIIRKKNVYLFLSEDYYYYNIVYRKAVAHLSLTPEMLATALTISCSWESPNFKKVKKNMIKLTIQECGN